jgi:hypothetical protein
MPYSQALEFSTISALETLVKIASKKGQNPYQKKHLAMLTTPPEFKPQSFAQQGFETFLPRQMCALRRW